MNSSRLITSVLLMLLGGTSLYFGQLSLLALLILVSLLATNEVISTLKKNQVNTSRVLCFTGIIAYYIYLYFYPQIGTINLLKSIIIILMLLNIIELTTKKYFLLKNRAFNSLKIFLQLSIPISYLYFIRTTESGLILSFMILSCIITSDSAAYFGGKLIGKNKLHSLSPKKTVEGTIIGFIATLIMGLTIILINQLNLVNYILIPLVIAVAAPLGDLHESLFKRKFKIKDSSNLLPGHGCIYDRIDSYLMALPISYLLL